MKVLFIAGFGPIAADVAESRRLYESALGIAFKVEEGEYLHTEQVDGARAFAVWPLSQAAESCFGTTEWPADIARPQAWLEFDVDDVETATRELEEAGYKLLVRNHRALGPGRDAPHQPGGIAGRRHHDALDAQGLIRRRG